MTNLEEYVVRLGAEEKSQSVIDGIKRCFNGAPLIILALLIYLGLRSSWIFPDHGTDLTPFRSPLWHSAYAGWYDVLLALAFCLTVLARSISIRRQSVDFLLVLSFIILLSFVNGSKLGGDYILDASLFFLRFSMMFILSVQLVRRLGENAVESLLITLFIVLAASALFVYSLQFGRSNRIYGSGMTVASFAQVAAVISFIAVFRRHNLLLVLSTIFLLLTFSRTSIIAFVLLTTVYLFRSKRLSFLAKMKYLIPIVAFLILSTLFLIKYGGPQFNFLLRDRLNTDQLVTLNKRDTIWEHGWTLLRSGYVPLTGVGFNAATSLFDINTFSFQDDKRDLHPASFHSIFLEYGFGLGIFSLIIFYYIFKRIVHSFTCRDHLVFFIFTFFIITQGLDFTFYRPKEVIIWSLLLGYAEGQWTLRRKFLFKAVNSYDGATPQIATAD